MADRAQGARSSRTETEAINPLEDVMDMSSVPTSLACGGFFVLSFVWFAERLRGANAPHV